MDEIDESLFDYPELELEEDKKVNLSDQEEMIYFVSSQTGLPFDICQIVLEKCYQEIRSKMLRGDIVVLDRLGSFFISCPLNGTHSGRGPNGVRPRFRPTKTLRKKVDVREYRKK